MQTKELYSDNVPQFTLSGATYTTLADMLTELVAQLKTVAGAGHAINFAGIWTTKSYFTGTFYTPEGRSFGTITLQWAVDDKRYFSFYTNSNSTTVEITPIA